MVLDSRGCKYNWWPITDLPQTLNALYNSMCLGKFTMTCTYYYGIIQCIFTALKIICVLPIYSSLPHHFTFSSLSFLNSKTDVITSVQMNIMSKQYEVLYYEVLYTVWERLFNVFLTNFLKPSTLQIPSSFFLLFAIMTSKPNAMNLPNGEVSWYLLNVPSWSLGKALLQDKFFLTQS